MVRSRWSQGALLGALVVLAACGGSSSRASFDQNPTDPAGGSLGTDRADASVGDETSKWNLPPCDTNGSTATDFAKTFGICASVDKDGFGLVSAQFTRGYSNNLSPNDAQHGVLTKFGNVLRPREGKTLGVLSTGYAEEYDGSPNAGFSQDGGQVWGGDGHAPPGFPKASSTCPSLAANVEDLVNLKLTLKAPDGANGFSFDFNFLSSEWPQYVCSSYNDSFIAYLTAKGFNGGRPDNVSFDKNKNPVSVNNGFFDRCTPGVATGCIPFESVPGQSVCPGGPAELAGTGFGIVDDYCGNGQHETGGGGTGWLTTQAPVQGGETFTLELMIWDTGDGKLDSSVLLDNFRWIVGPISADTGRPVK